MRIILQGDDALLTERERAALHRIARERRDTRCPWLAERCDRWVGQLLARNARREWQLRNRAMLTVPAPTSFVDTGGLA